MISSARNRCPFTPNQWQELEHQALIFKYMVSGVPIPPELIYSVKRSLDSSLASHLFPQQPTGRGCYQVGFGRKVDPEPGRCRRTDGKKWRCSKEAYPDSRYCERHMHRGKNRSKKPMEVNSTTTTTTTTTSILSPSFSSINNRNTFPYSHHPSTAASGLSVQLSNDTSTSPHQFLDFGDGNSYRYVNGTREGVTVDERSFFPEGLRSVTTADSYQPLAMSLYRNFGDTRSKDQCFVLGTDIKSARPIKYEKDEETQKPVHQLFGDWLSRNTGSCLDLASNSDS